MNKFLKTLFLLFVSGYSFAQVTTSNVSGIVKDASSNPLEGVT
ncbi:MAG: hypothetical protein RJB16_1032, partial [Bacteroidota bacterium]